jgi:hypothetical protein
LRQPPLHQADAARPSQRHQHVEAARLRIGDGQIVDHAQVDLHLGKSLAEPRQRRHEQQPRQQAGRSDRERALDPARRDGRRGVGLSELLDQRPACVEVRLALRREFQPLGAAVDEPDAEFALERADQFGH